MTIHAWVLSIALPSDARSTLVLSAPARHELRAEPDQRLTFQVPDGQHVYASSKTTGFATPPTQTALPLEAEREYSLTADIELAGGSPTLWLIEYDERERLCHHTWRLLGGALNVRWKTHARHRSVCVAIRLAGHGTVAVRNLRLVGLGAPHAATANEPTQTTAPDFREPSIFFDPSGYRRSAKRYDDRDPAWPANLAKRLLGCARVLELGCGPGLLLAALAAEGISQAIGLERDEVDLARCRERGVTAIAHDLDDPAPFLESASFDGVVAHHVLEGCAPIAVRTVLRECMRVLRPGGKLVIVARTGGQVTGDVTRTVSLAPELLSRLLIEAGFVAPEVEETGDDLRVIVRKTAAPVWPTRPTSGDVQTQRTEVSSIDADRSASRGGGDWQTTRDDLYRVREDRLIAAPGATDDTHALTRSIALTAETQCTFRIASSAGRGAIVLQLDDTWRFEVRADGHCFENDRPCETTLPAGAACAIRILRSNEAWLQIWDGDRVAWSRRWALGAPPRQLSVSLRVPPGEPPMTVDFVDVWSPEILEVDSEPRTLGVPAGATATLDTYDQICEAAAKQPRTIFPVMRHRALPRPDEEFEVNQLEVAWQAGRLFGLAMSPQDPPPDAILAWCERRGVIAMWFVRSLADVAWLEAHVRTSPMVITADAPPDDDVRACVLALVQRVSTVYVTSVFAPDASRPYQVLGSPSDANPLARSENLRFLTERVQWTRWEALRTRTELRFPALPRDAAELVEQGFEVIAPDRMPPAEYDQAKEFWAQYGVQRFYQQHKPWASLLVRLVGDLKPRSILEFGCNVGRNLHAIREAFPDIRLVGLDINEDAVKAGREGAQLDLRVGDEQTLATFAEGEFDLVFTVSVLDHMSEIGGVTRSLLRVARHNAVFLEVTLPLEGKVQRHFDHKHGEVRPSTGASYSWDVAKYLEGLPRLTRLDRRPIYMHPASLGPYYWTYLAFLDSP